MWRYMFNKHASREVLHQGWESLLAWTIYAEWLWRPLSNPQMLVREGSLRDNGMSRLRLSSWTADDSGGGVLSYMSTGYVVSSNRFHTMLYTFLLGWLSSRPRTYIISPRSAFTERTNFLGISVYACTSHLSHSYTRTVVMLVENWSLTTCNNLNEMEPI